MNLLNYINLYNTNLYKSMKIIITLNKLTFYFYLIF